MGRQRSTNKNLPDGVQARRRLRKNGTTAVYYYYTTRQNGKRKEIPLGTDYHQALLCYAQMEINAAADTAHAWMIAWNDTYAVAAFVQDGDSGSGTAGPLIKDMFS